MDRNKGIDASVILEAQLKDLTTAGIAGGGRKEFTMTQFSCLEG